MAAGPGPVPVPVPAATVPWCAKRRHRSKVARGSRLRVGLAGCRSRKADKNVGAPVVLPDAPPITLLLSGFSVSAFQHGPHLPPRATEAAMVLLRPGAILLRLTEHLLTL